jgi:hypothetical protein
VLPGSGESLVLKQLWCVTHECCAREPCHFPALLGYTVDAKEKPRPNCRVQDKVEMFLEEGNFALRCALIKALDEVIETLLVALP